MNCILVDMEDTGLVDVDVAVDAAVDDVDDVVDDIFDADDGLFRLSFFTLL